MANRNRPRGRKKKVGTGSVRVSRRGSSASRKTQGRVGASRRTTSLRPGSMSSSSRPPSSGNIRPSMGLGGSGLNGRPRVTRRSSGCLSKIVMIVVIVVVLFIAYQLFFGGGSNVGDSDSDDFTYSNDITSINESLNTDTFTDSEAYPVNQSVSELARDKYTKIIGNGQDEVTLMIYIIGSDLESRSGMATGDIQEIMAADISDQVNVIMETGGTKEWKNSVVSSSTNQRYQVTREGLLPLDEKVGKKSMVEPETLTDFIKFSKTNYPADRYMLILWDHGGGSLSGFGHDELFKGDTMDLGEIRQALDDSDTYFDFIGFDACLMGTLETAMTLEPFSDYMIASEELEPGIGWYYTEWISLLSDNPSIETTDLGKKLIDDYVTEVAKKTPRSQATLSLMDLAELKGTIPDALVEFAQSTGELLDTDDYQTVSDARAGAKEFAASSKINQIDLIHFAEDIGTPEALEFAEALRNMVKYNRTSTNIKNANGVSIYFPYNKLSKTGSMVDTYEEIGMEDEYTEVVKDFASMAAGGQIITQETGGSGGLLGQLLGSGNSGQSTSNLTGDIAGQLIGNFLSGGGLTDMLGNAAGNWLNTDQVEESADYYSNNTFDPTLLKISEKQGDRVIELPEDQWSLVQDIELNVFIDDGGGFIDLGLDNVFDWNTDGDLIMEYDGTWLTLNGNVVSYYMISNDENGDSYTIRGRIPALLNDELVDIIVEFSDTDPYGSVLGASVNYGDDGDETFAKGLIDIQPGDVIDFLCDYYTYDGDYTDTYYLGQQYIATDYWTVENLSISNLNYQMMYRFTDIYGNHYWTPTINN